MISIELARKLRNAGLEWLPTQGDRFMIPDRDLEDHVFSISEMTVEAHKLRDGVRISFNGAVEWALDSIMQREVIWLPSETQLRNRLGSAFDSLHYTPDGYRCDVVVDDRRRTYEAADPENAYALALLDLLAEPDTMMRLIVEDPGETTGGQP